MTLEDLASGDDREIYTFRDVPRHTWIKVAAKDTAPAEEIGTEEFPQYGEFLAVEVRLDSDRFSGELAGGERLSAWLEVPRVLAKEIVTAVEAADREDPVGLWFLLAERELIGQTWRAMIETAWDPPFEVEDADDAMG